MDGKGMGGWAVAGIAAGALLAGMALGHYGGKWLASAEADAKKLAGGAVAK